MKNNEFVCPIKFKIKNDSWTHQLLSDKHHRSESKNLCVNHVIYTGRTKMKLKLSDFCCCYFLAAVDFCILDHLQAIRVP